MLESVLQKKLFDIWNLHFFPRVSHFILKLFYSFQNSFVSPLKRNISNYRHHKNKTKYFFLFSFISFKVQIAMAKWNSNFWMLFNYLNWIDSFMAMEIYVPLNWLGRIFANKIYQTLVNQLNDIWICAGVRYSGLIVSNEQTFLLCLSSFAKFK